MLISPEIEVSSNALEIKVIFPQNNQFTVQSQSQDCFTKIFNLVYSVYVNKFEPVDFLFSLWKQSKPLEVKNIYGNISETTIKFILNKKEEVKYKIKGSIFSGLNDRLHEKKLNYLRMHYNKHNSHMRKLDEICKTDPYEEGFSVATHFDTTHIDDLIHEFDNYNPDLASCAPDIEWLNTHPNDIFK